MQNLSNVTGSVLARTQSLAVVYFRTLPRNETNRKIHVNIFTILIVCYGQVKALVGSQVRSVLAFLLTTMYVQRVPIANGTRRSSTAGLCSR